MQFNTDLFAKMREAASLLQTEGPMAATAALQNALGVTMPTASAPVWSSPLQRPHVMRDINPRSADAVANPAGAMQDILERFRQSAGDGWSSKWADLMPGMTNPADATDVTDVADADIVEDHGSANGQGRFIAGVCANQAGKRAYKLYIPGSYRGRESKPLPLVVMLHGCKQNPDDFTAGTRMNQVAEEQQCFVVYPAQAQNANGSNCWNWFKTEDQQRERGEPSIIADITRQIMRDYSVDPQRVYVAGLSAGGAMATVMGNAYPDLYAAVGIHSGLPHGVAHDMPSAFATMRGGMPANPPRRAASSARQPIPVIVFHGDRDHTVHPRNGDQALAQCLAHPVPKASRADCRGKPTPTIEKGQVPNGRAYTRVVQYDDDGKAVAEQWTIHGAGHAWSGGSRNGSYTDPAGPHASREMLRFFYSHSKKI